MSLSIGIVGLPNVGKSTLFTATHEQRRFGSQLPLRHHRAQRRHRPVPDDRLENWPKSTILPRSFPQRSGSSISPVWWRVPAGRGLGNQFLANIRETDAICEVVRFFSDPDVVRRRP